MIYFQVTEVRLSVGCGYMSCWSIVHLENYTIIVWMACMLHCMIFHYYLACTLFSGMVVVVATLCIFIMYNFLLFGNNCSKSNKKVRHVMYSSSKSFRIFYLGVFIDLKLCGRCHFVGSETRFNGTHGTELVFMWGLESFHYIHIRINWWRGIVEQMFLFQTISSLFYMNLAGYINLCQGGSTSVGLSYL